MSYSLERSIRKLTFHREVVSSVKRGCEPVQETVESPDDTRCHMPAWHSETNQLLMTLQS